MNQADSPEAGEEKQAEASGVETISDALPPQVVNKALTGRNSGADRTSDRSHPFGPALHEATALF
jgi:hypothetical protein